MTIFPMHPKTETRKLLAQEGEGGTRLFTEDGYEFKNVVGFTQGTGAYGPTTQLLRLDLLDWKVERVIEPPGTWAARDAAVKKIAHEIALQACPQVPYGYQQIYDAARLILDMQMPRPASPLLLEGRLRALAAKWCEGHSGPSADRENTAAEVARETCAEELEALLDEVKL